MGSKENDRKAEKRIRRILEPLIVVDAAEFMRPLDRENPLQLDNVNLALIPESNQRLSV